MHLVSTPRQICPCWPDLEIHPETLWPLLTSNVVHTFAHVGRVAVGLFNRSPAAAVITANWADLGLSTAAEYDAVDVWSGESVGKQLRGSVSSHTEHHSLTLLVLTPSSP